MINKDEALFNACMEFCQSYTHFLVADTNFQQSRMMGHIDDWDMRDIRKYELKQLRYSFDKLKEAIKDVEEV